MSLIVVKATYCVCLHYNMLIYYEVTVKGRKLDTSCLHNRCKLIMSLHLLVSEINFIFLASILQ